MYTADDDVPSHLRPFIRGLLARSLALARARQLRWFEQVLATEEMEALVRELGNQGNLAPTIDYASCRLELALGQPPALAELIGEARARTVGLDAPVVAVLLEVREERVVVPSLVVRGQVAGKHLHVTQEGVGVEIAPGELVRAARSAAAGASLATLPFRWDADALGASVAKVAGELRAEARAEARAERAAWWSERLGTLLGFAAGGVGLLLGLVALVVSVVVAGAAAYYGHEVTLFLVDGSRFEDELAIAGAVFAWLTVFGSLASAIEAVGKKMAGLDPS